MTKEIIMPQYSITMEEGKISEWKVKEGDFVKKGQVILEIETDKTVMDVEVEYDGYIRKIIYGNGDVVKVTEAIAFLTDNMDEDILIKSILKETNENKEDHKIKSSRVLISPIAKKAAEANNIDYTTIKGSGPDGRITKEDIENELKLKTNKKKSELTEHIKKEEKASETEMTSEEASNFRKTIARNMSANKAEVPHYYVTMKIDATEMVNFRDKAGKYMRDNNKSPLPFSAILIKIVANAIEQHPVYQSYFHDNRIYKYPSINIGLAVDINDMLMVPVVKDANNKRLTQIAQETASLIDKCRQNKITADDLSEGCFVISNLGMYDVDDFTAIISKGQSGILALGKIKEEPVVINGAIEIRKILTATLSSDHRLIDGSKAAKFLKTIKDHIENIYLF